MAGKKMRLGLFLAIMCAGSVLTILNVGLDVPLPLPARVVVLFFAMTHLFALVRMILDLDAMSLTSTSKDVSE